MRGFGSGLVRGSFTALLSVSHWKPIGLYTATKVATNKRHLLILYVIRASPSIPFRQGCRPMQPCHVANAGPGGSSGRGGRISARPDNVRQAKRTATARLEKHGGRRAEPQWRRPNTGLWKIRLAMKNHSAPSLTRCERPSYMPLVSRQ